MPTIVGLSGSLRKGSYNSMLLRAAAELAPAGTTIAIESIRDIPLYDGDVEAADGLPAAVRALKDKIAASDGLLLVSPEYNNSIPGVFKNAIDWLSRPGSDIGRVFGGRPVVVIGASPGPWGTGQAQTAWLPVLRQLTTQPWFGARLLVPNAASVFDADGKLTDAKIRAQLEKVITGFAQFVARLAAAPAAG